MNDDASSSAFSHITQNLAAGNYTLLVTYCCGGTNALQNSATSSPTDGFNLGSYYIGGPATLSSVEAFLNAQAYGGLAGGQFSVELTNAALGSGNPGNPVPEPESIALFGLALVALSLARRHSATGML